MPSIYDWSLTPGNNATADADINWAENQLPYTVNDSARQMMARIAEFWRDQGGAITSSGTNTVTATFNSGFTVLANGQMIAIRAGGTNTGAATFNPNSIGAKAIRQFVGGAEEALAGGEIIANGHYILQYDTAANSAAGAWILLNPAPVKRTFGTVTNLTLGGGSADPTGVVYSNQTAHWERVGNIGTIHGRLTLTNNGSGGSGSLIIRGSPLTFANNRFALAPVRTSGLTWVANTISVYMLGNGASLLLEAQVNLAGTNEQVGFSSFQVGDAQDAFDCIFGITGIVV